VSAHWWYVAAAWGLAAVLFGVLLATTLHRQTTARRRLSVLEAHRPARGLRPTGGAEQMPGRGAA
jgi:uncharacterized membrane protein